MKKIVLFYFLLNSVVSFSQEDVFGNSPVHGIIPIKRGDIQEKSVIANRNATTISNATPSTPTGNSTEVGVTEGQLSVSLTGGATYNIPIAVPPGINGIVPQVSLSYNSQGGNGLAGYGWNISGVSVITRIPTTKFHDNIIDGVDFNSLDRFALDGQRLIVKNGTTGVYGANGTVYETESFSNVQITSYGVHPSGANYGPAYFIVQYPDGSIAHYGNSTTSRSLTDWAITYWQNPQGVRISYNYVLSNNNLSISTVSYGTRLTTTPINEISFVYKNRTRQEQAYIGGQSFVRSTILSEIRVKGHNIGFRNYLLSHEATSLGYERLKSITEKSGDNTKSFNPTVFNYETTIEDIAFNTNSATLSIGNIRSDNSATVQGDFDGDGNMDIILYPTTGANSNKKYWLFSDIQGTGLNIGSEHNVGTFTEIFPTSWLSWNNKLMPMQGWCVIQHNTSSNLTSFKNYSTGIANPIYFQYEKTYQFPKITYSYWKYPCGNGGGTNPILDPGTGDPIDPIVTEPTWTEIVREIPKEYASGDFNGDGLTDVLIIEKSLTYSIQNYCTSSTQSYSGGKVYFFDLDRRLTTNTPIVAGYFQTTNNSKFITADFNGDGKTDIFIFDDNICRVYTLNNSNNIILITTINSTNINLSKPILMGDYNGDGKADFMIPKVHESNLFTKYISIGNNVAYTEFDTGFPYLPNFYDGNASTIQQIIPNDFNNDGKTDFIITRCRYVHSGAANWVNQNRFISVRYFANKGTTFESSMFTVKQDNTGINHFPIPVSLSFDKENSNKQISFISNNNIYSALSPKDNVIDTSLKEIILGNGVKEVISYQPLNNDDLSYDNAFFPSTSTENYPNFDIKVANNFRIVSKLEQVTATQYKQQKLKYYGAVSNVEGLGFLGFRGLARTNWFNDDNPVISSVSKHDITKRGAAIETFSVLGETFGNFTNYSPSSFINKTNMTYVDQLLSNKVYKINNTVTISSNGLEVTSKEVTTTYDTNNNPLTTTSLSKNGTTTERTEVVNIEYFPSTTSPTYVIGRLKKKNSSVTHNGDTMTGEEIYTYNTAHLVSNIQKKGHLTNYLTEDNSIYDVFGNIRQKKITAVGLTPRITNFTYDPTGRFLMSSTDIEGLVTSYTYNTSNGLLLTETLPSNAGYPLITTYGYDVWGKKIKETDYLGKNLNLSYSWLSAGLSGNFVLSTSGDDNSSTFSWYDDLGRKIAEGFRTINDASSSESNNSWKTFEYDIYDRERKSYEPQLSLLPQWSGLFSTTTYDFYGRTTQVVEHTGKTSNINYDGLTTTASDGVSNATVIKNSLGNIVSKTDNGGTINYQYYANGNLKQSNFGGVIVAVEQDGWGRKTKLIDPSAGTYEYQYNEFGEMKKEITPKGETSYTIDNFGKVTVKTIQGTGGDPTNTKTTYTYNPTTKLLTNTRYDDFAGGFYTLYSYGYDNYKRINFNDESGFNAYYQRATFFDAFGRPEKELYTAVNTSDNKRSDKWVKNTYKNGHHWQILDDATNQVLWQTSKVNARGQLTNGNYGNGISVTNTYDQYGLPTQFKHDKTTSPAVNIMTLNTVFETQRGNLTSRYNSMFDYQENFTYDNLDRLTNWKETGDLLSNHTFSTTSTEGFQSVAGATLSLTNGGLLTTAIGQGKGTEKLVLSNSVSGKTINVKGVFQNYSTANGTILNLRIYEKNISTGIVVSTSSIPITPGNFSYAKTIVNSGCNVFVKLDISNPNVSNASMSFHLDNITFTLSVDDFQSYDTLGRINENNVGTYNYTNINQANSVPKHFQNSSIITKPDYQNYYQNRANLDITYNAFKSPIDIIEEGKDKISFIYNMNNSRSTMYYGSLETNKLSRRFRKHYSADGTMEIKQDMVNGTVEFITYIGGDGYTAPVILKSDGTTQQYMYLHRDYLGSIVAVTNQAGAVVEKRLFDAWGNIKRIQDGAGNNLTKLTVIERGYTGHEHLQGVVLIHMNGRLYDPVIHRFLQPDNFISDPQNTQAFNRYSYVLNNPLKYSDASGELPVLVVAAIVGAIAGGAGYIAHAIQTGNWSWGGFGMAVVGGAAVGALTGGLGGASATCVTLSAAGNAAASSFVAAFFPAISVPVGDWSFSISPSIAFGNASGAGVSFGVSYSDGDWSFSGGVGIMSYGNYNGFGANSNEIRYSILANYDDGKTGFSLGTNFWRGSAGSDGNNLNQRTGVIGFHSNDFNVMYENDGGFGMDQLQLGDKGDSYRTAALNLSIGDFTAGFNLMTGYRGRDNQEYENENMKIGKNWKFGTQDQYGAKFPRGYVHETGNKYRLGALSVGYKGYRVGINSERIRHAIQDKAIHGIIGDAGFQNTSWNVKGYFQHKTPNIFTSW
ncbi:polymorphic toxin type 23 domain-containing protein [Flavobacterium sp. j3]|uniref:Polymorphic toxin type 23 domain-containing protein n=1 Tax=Flavobacterium aureirubrum TaxID=3133147 RepID=A0ABU9N3N4_9FLAO